MNFAEVVEKLYQDRLKDLNGIPTRKFYFNSRGVKETRFSIETFQKVGDKFKSIGKKVVYYADQNANGRSAEAEAVRKGKWKAWEVGWLWTILDGSRLWLAKISPLGAKQLTQGFLKGGKLYLGR